MRAVAAHIANLPSSRTPEQHTRRGYQRHLEEFMVYAGDRFPTFDLLTEYVAHSVARGRSSSTISKHLAPVRHYLRALVRQRIVGLMGEPHTFVLDCKEDLRLALDIRAPRREITSNVSALYNPKFVRLTIEQVRTVLASIDRTTRKGLRDFALLHVALTTGLRLAELARITPSSITSSDEAGLWLVTVRGKRNNFDAVPLADDVYQYVQEWVEAYNSGIRTSDSRRIEADTPIWQALSRTGGYLIEERNGFSAERGLSHQGIRDMVALRTGVLGPEYTCGVHDLRRSVAAMAAAAGMGIVHISKLLRHLNIQTTSGYIGDPQDYGARLITNYVSFSLSTAA